MVFFAQRPWFIAWTSDNIVATLSYGETYCLCIFTDEPAAESFMAAYFPGRGCCLGRIDHEKQLAPLLDQLVHPPTHAVFDPPTRDLLEYNPRRVVCVLDELIGR
jgi:hypothetical protein